MSKSIEKQLADLEAEERAKYVASLEMAAGRAMRLAAEHEDDNPIWAKYLRRRALRAASLAFDLESE